MTEDTRMILKELSKVNERLNRMNDRFDGVDRRLDKVDDRLDKMDDRFDRMDERLDKMDERFDRMDDRFDKMDQRVDNLEKTTKGELRAIKMYLENEIEPKISIVAEGHIDLMRKFQKIQVCNEEWEMMKMRVLALERGVREIKAKMDVA
jgi:chromosome segregation ATPase